MALVDWCGRSRGRQGRTAKHQTKGRREVKGNNEKTSWTILHDQEFLHSSEESQGRGLGCWRLFRWPYNIAPHKNWHHSLGLKLNGRRKSVSSKIHPLSSKLIRERNMSIREDVLTQGKALCDEPTSSPVDILPQFGSDRGQQDEPNWSAGIGMQAVTLPEPTPSCGNWCRDDMGLSQDNKESFCADLLSLWPLTRKVSVPEDDRKDLASIFTDESSWKYFYSSESVLQSFLKDARSIQKDGSKLKEYRCLLLKGNLNSHRLRRYPKPVLRVFVLLLRGKEPPLNATKTALVEWCVNWRCRNKTFWCSLERSHHEPVKIKGSEELKAEVHQQIGAPKVGKELQKDPKKIRTSLLCGAQPGITAGLSSECHGRETKSIHVEEQAAQDPQHFGTLGNGGEKYLAASCSSNRESCQCSHSMTSERFCYGCMCVTCKYVIQPGEEWRVIKCHFCAHLSHLNCSLKGSMKGFEIDKVLDGELLCLCCGSKQDMLDFWLDRLDEARKGDNVFVVERILSSAVGIFEDTERERYKGVQALLGEAWSQIMNGGQEANARSQTHLICNDLHDRKRSALETEIDAKTWTAVGERASFCTKMAEEDQARVNETFQEVELCKGILRQAQRRLQRLQTKLTSRSQNALLSRVTAIIAHKRLKSHSNRPMFS